MGQASCAQDHELSLELILAVAAAPGGFFLCVYCNHKFRSSQAPGGHQITHRPERSIARRRLENAAATRVQYLRYSLSTASKARARAAATRMPEPAGSKRGRSSSEGADELDLSLRL